MTKKDASQSRAIVAGAGIGGLAAAAAAAKYFDEVLLFEKDPTPERRSARPGVAQGRHTHLMLRGGAAALDSLLPGFSDDMAGAGAAVYDVGADFPVFDYNSWRSRFRHDVPMQIMSRPALEHLLCDRVTRLDNVSIRHRESVESIVLENGEVRGVRLKGRDGAETLSADFVVDARGRSGALARDLAAAGYGDTPETVIGIDMTYSSGHFRLPRPAGDTDKAMLFRCDPPGTRFGLITAIEDGEWSVTLAGRGEDAPPTDLSGFFAYAKSFDTDRFYEFIKDGELVGDLHRYKKPKAVWRRFDQLNEFPARLAPIGDVITSFNPIFAQGMTVAALQAVALSETLSDHAANDGGFFRAYIDKALVASESAWRLAALTDFAYPQVTGEAPPDVETFSQLTHAVKLVADENPAVQRTFLKVIHMEEPETVLQTPEIMALVMQKLGELNASSGV